MDSVNFIFLVETAATCILDYMLYIHEKDKDNPLEKKQMKNFLFRTLLSTFLLD